MVTFSIFDFLWRCWPHTWFWQLLSFLHHVCTTYPQYLSWIISSHVKSFSKFTGLWRNTLNSGLFWKRWFEPLQIRAMKVHLGLDLMAQNTNERGKISASDCGFNLPTVFGSLETGSQRLNQEEQVPYLLIWTLAIILLYRCPKYSHSENEYYRKQNQHQSVNEECRHFLLASRISYFCLILMTMLRFIFDNTLDSKD